jgi:uncharacterized damage-inducible protein DinB
MSTMVRAVAGERDALLAFLDAQREALRYAVRDLTEEQATARPTVSELSLAGLVKHLARCERGWIYRMVGRSDPYPERAENWPAEFRLGEGETLAGALALYAEVAAETEQLVSELADLELTVALPNRPWLPPDTTVSARWILLHLIEETARHAGHADIIRESLDGATSYQLRSVSSDSSRR